LGLRNVWLWLGLLPKRAPLLQHSKRAGPFCYIGLAQLHVQGRGIFKDRGWWKMENGRKKNDRLGTTKFIAKKNIHR